MRSHEYIGLHLCTYSTIFLLNPKTYWQSCPGRILSFVQSERLYFSFEYIQPNSNIMSDMDSITNIYLSILKRTKIRATSGKFTTGFGFIVNPFNWRRTVTKRKSSTQMTSQNAFWCVVQNHQPSWLQLEKIKYVSECLSVAEPLSWDDKMLADFPLSVTLRPTGLA